MKNFIKLLLVLLASSLSLFIASASYTSTLSIKKVGVESFSDNTTINSSGDSFIMNISLVPLYDKKTRVNISGLPAGINPNSFAIDGNTCGNDISNINYVQTSNTLYFTYTPASSSICVITTQYTTAGVASGTYTIKPTLTDSVDNIFDNGNDIISTGNSVNIKVTGLVQITEADAIDTDNDGFLDGYNITFNKTPGASLDPTKVIIRTEEKEATGIAYSATQQRITFDDNKFTSGEKPLIEIKANTLGYEQMKYPVSIINDRAKPVISSYNASINKGESINIVFNEKMKEAETLNSAKLYYQGTLKSSYPSYNSTTNTLTLSPTSTIYEGRTYTVGVTSAALDWENNTLNPRYLSVYINRSSSGGGGGGGGGSTPTYDNESKEMFFNKIISLENAVNSDTKVIGKVEIPSSNITNSGETIRLYGNSKQVSNLLIQENTNISSISSSWDKYLYPFLKYDLNSNKVKDQEYLNLGGKQVKTYNVDSIGFVGSEDKILTLNKDATIQIKLSRVYASSDYYVFYNDGLDGEWTQLNGAYKADGDSIYVDTNKLGNIVVIRDRYYKSNSTSEGNILTQYSTLEEARNALLQETTNTKLPPFINKYYEYLNLNNLEYFTSFDTELKAENDKLISAYYNTFDAFNKYLAGDTKVITSAINKDMALVEGQKKARKNLILEKRYVDIVTELDNSVIYKVKQEEFKAIFEKLENKFVGKLRRLRDNDNIDEAEYQTALSAYNNLILNWAIYKEFNKLPEALNRAMQAVVTLNKTYTKKVIYKPVIIEPQILLVKDVYTLTKTLQVGDYNDEVRNLQAIMRMYGYFNYASDTGYFGEVTKAALIRFAAGELDYNSTGMLTDELREKILNLEIYDTSSTVK